MVDRLKTIVSGDGLHESVFLQALNLAGCIKGSRNDDICKAFKDFHPSQQIINSF